MRKIAKAITVGYVLVFSMSSNADEAWDQMQEQQQRLMQQRQFEQDQAGQYQQEQERQQAERSRAEQQEREQAEMSRAQQPQYTRPELPGSPPVLSAPPPVYYGAIAVDPESRKFGGAWNYTDSSTALAAAEDSCAQVSHSNRCISRSTRDRFIAVAISSDNRVVRMATSNSYASADKSAMEDCKNAGGNDCEVGLGLDSAVGPVELRWGGLAYDPSTGKKGASMNHYTQKKAVEAAVQQCNSGNCWSIGFQQSYAAMAVGPDKKVSYATSNDSMKKAVEEAVDECQKQSNSKTCTIVAKGTASGEWSENDAFLVIVFLMAVKFRQQKTR